MPKDMQLLRDLWHRISPESCIGAPDEETRRQKAVRATTQTQKLIQNKRRMQARVNQLRSRGTLQNLTKGEVAFCTSNNIKCS
jgi:hypothetical protein